MLVKEKRKMVGLWLTGCWRMVWKWKTSDAVSGVHLALKSSHC